MNLESQKQKLTLEFDSYIQRLTKFLDQNKKFSGRCLNRIKIISSEIVTSEELNEGESANGGDANGGDANGGDANGGDANGGDANGGDGA